MDYFFIFVFIIIFIIFYLVDKYSEKYIMSKKTKYAIAVFDTNDIKGNVIFSQKNPDSKVKIQINLSGLGKNRKRGFHIHQYGDLSDSCTSMCAHFNPLNKTHGGLNSIVRHAGDLGNVQSDDNGNANYNIYAHGISLYGSKFNIIGRGLIIHEDEDDLGLGNHDDSHITGHAGKRSACAVIGLSKLNKPC